MPSLSKPTQTSLSEINMVPFIDIVLVLLIIFMITAPILQSGIELDVPKTHAVKEITDQALLGDFLDGVRFGDVQLDAGLQDGRGDHEDDEENQYDVDERHHVDLGERGLRGFGKGRHKSEIRTRS